MPIGKKFGTNALNPIWAITYFSSLLIKSKKQHNHLFIKHPHSANKFRMRNSSFAMMLWLFKSMTTIIKLL